MSSGLVLQNFDARAIGRANRGRDGGVGHKGVHGCRAALTTSLNNLSEYLICRTPCREPGARVIRRTDRGGAGGVGHREGHCCWAAPE